MIFLGCDWAENKHDFVVLDNDALQRDEVRPLLYRVVKHDARALDLLAAEIADIEPDPAEVHVGVERHDGALMDWLLARGYTVYNINPKSAERARDRHRPSGAKSDFYDALGLADFVRTDRARLRTIEPDSPLALELRSLLALRGDLVEQKTKAMQKLHGLLANRCPALKALCGDLNRAWQRHLLMRTPLHRDLAALHGNALNALLNKERISTTTAEKIRQARHVAPMPIRDELAPVLRLQIRQLVETVDRLIAQIGEVEQAMEDALARHPDTDIFRSLPVRGLNSLAAILAAFGENRDHPLTWQVRAMLLGAAPVTAQSGKFRRINRRRGYDHVIHQALLYFTLNTTRVEGCWARDFYRRKRAEGKTHYAALRAIMQRWIKILNRMWLDRVPYDEGLHQRNKQRQTTQAA